jgi:hypothetical protein
MEETKESLTPKRSRKFTRRQVLKGAFWAGVGLGLSTILGPEERKEKLTKLPSDAIMVDFAPEKKTEGIKQEKFPNNRKVMEEILGKEYRAPSQLVMEFGLKALNREALEKRVFSKYPRLALVYGFMEQFARHGENVASVMRLALGRSEFEGEPHLIPLQEMLGGYEFTCDELGNYGLFGGVDPEKIIKALINYPKQQIVNFSFQIGRVGFIYREKSRDVNPDWAGEFPTVVTIKDKEGKTSKSILKEGKSVAVTEEELEEIFKKIEKGRIIVVEHEPFFDIEDAYTREMAKENLPKLFRICNAFPDKLFVVAAGNYGDDFVTERTTLKDQWPNNLIMVAEWGKMGPVGHVEGADVYVDNKALGVDSGSSYSTPIITAAAWILRNQGLTLSEIKENIYSFCDSKTYESWDLQARSMVQKTVRVLNPNKGVLR